MRWARAQAHHSSSVGNRTSHCFSPPERIGTTKGFVASKTGFFVSSIVSSLLADVASGGVMTVTVTRPLVVLYIWTPVI